MILLAAATLNTTDTELVHATWWLVYATIGLGSIGIIAAIAAGIAARFEWIAIGDARRQGQLELKPYVMSDLFASGQRNSITNIGGGPAVRVAAVYFQQEIPEREAWNAGICHINGMASNSSQMVTSQTMRDVPVSEVTEAFGHIVNRCCVYEDVFGNRYLWDSSNGYSELTWQANGKEPEWARLWATVFSLDGVRIEIKSAR